MGEHYQQLREYAEKHLVQEHDEMVRVICKVWRNYDLQLQSVNYFAAKPYSVLDKRTDTAIEFATMKEACQYCMIELERRILERHGQCIYA